MNILYLDHYAGSVKHGRSFRPYYLGKEWIKKGHRLTVVGASYSHIRSMQPQQVGLEDIEGIQYLWLRTPSYTNNGLKRFWSMIVFTIQLFWNLRRITKLNPPDVVIASTVYMLDIFPAWIIKKFSGAKIVFELHDIWPTSPQELGSMSKWHPFILLLSLTERFVYKVSDRVISILPKTYHHMKKFGVKEDNFFYIPNGIDLQDWKLSTPLPKHHDAILTKLKEQGYFLIGYTGSHAISNALTTLLDAAALLKNEKIYFILIGDGQEKQNLQAYAKENAISHVCFLDSIAKRSIPVALSHMDALYLGWQKQPLYRFGIGANKIFDYMMAQKPILHAVNAGNDPVAEAQCGLSVDAQDAKALAKAILDLKAMPLQEHFLMGKRGKDYVLKHHDYTVLAKQFLSALR